MKSSTTVLQSNPKLPPRVCQGVPASFSVGLKTVMLATEFIKENFQNLSEEYKNPDVL
jgi:hypothetical protein